MALEAVPAITGSSVTGLDGPTAGSTFGVSRPWRSTSHGPLRTASKRNRNKQAGTPSPSTGRRRGPGCCPYAGERTRATLQDRLHRHVLRQDIDGVAERIVVVVGPIGFPDLPGLAPSNSASARPNIDVRKSPSLDRRMPPPSRPVRTRRVGPRRGQRDESASRGATPPHATASGDSFSSALDMPRA
jgi:hypothetical protein